MTTHRDWLAAMLAEAGDDLVRLAFADWLQEINEEARAEWVRLSVAASHAAGSREERDARLADRDRAFARCRPDYFAAMTSIRECDERGMVSLDCEPTIAALERLRRADWLRRAVAEGWLAGVTLSWVNDAVIDAVCAAWAGGARGVPLSTASHLSSRGLAALLGLPDLAELRLNAAAVGHAAMDGLSACAALTALTLEVGTAADADADRALAAAARLPRLRRLVLVGEYGGDARRPVRADLLALAAAPPLRWVLLASCWHLSDDDMAAFRAAAPHLAIARSGPTRPRQGPVR